MEVPLDDFCIVLEALLLLLRQLLPFLRKELGDLCDFHPGVFILEGRPAEARVDHEAVEWALRRACAHERDT